MDASELFKQHFYFFLQDINDNNYDNISPFVRIKKSFLIPFHFKIKYLSPRRSQRLALQRRKPEDDVPVTELPPVPQ